MKVLLVYELVPERTDFYVFTDPTDEQTSALRGSHGTFINSEMTTDEQADAADFLSELLAELPTNVTKIDDTKSFKPIEGPFDRVFHAGFIM